MNLGRRPQLETRLAKRLNPPADLWPRKGETIWNGCGEDQREGMRPTTWLIRCVGGEFASDMPPVNESPFERSRWRGGRFACVEVSMGALMGVFLGHKEVSYDPFTPNDARGTRASQLLS